MNKRLKKAMFSISGLSALGLESTNVQVMSSEFNIRTVFNYNTGDLKEDSALYAVVMRDGSTKSFHKEWFHIVDSNGELRGKEKFFSYCSDGNLEEILTQNGYRYYLEAKREHLIEPETTVYGRGNF